MKLHEYDEMTPRELNIIIEEYSKKRDMDRKDNIFHAYLTSRWVWAKKIDIDKILENKPEKKIMTDEQMENQARMLNQMFGGTEVSN